MEWLDDNHIKNEMPEEDFQEKLRFGPVGRR